MLLMDQLGDLLFLYCTTVRHDDEMQVHHTGR
jgi:hypothetical protein